MNARVYTHKKTRRRKKGTSFSKRQGINFEAYRQLFRLSQSIFAAPHHGIHKTFSEASIQPHKKTSELSHQNLGTFAQKNRRFYIETSAVFHQSIQNTFANAREGYDKTEKNARENKERSAVK